MVEIVDTFVNEFGILILIAAQAIIFTWYYDVDELIPVLNENSRINVGKKWKFTLKYILPLVLIVLWIVGIVDILQNIDLFKVGIYLVITLIVIVLSAIFVKIKPKNSSS